MAPAPSPSNVWRTFAGSTTIRVVSSGWRAAAGRARNPARVRRTPARRTGEERVGTARLRGGGRRRAYPGRARHSTAGRELLRTAGPRRSNVLSSGRLNASGEPPGGDRRHNEDRTVARASLHAHGRGDGVGHLAAKAHDVPL